MKRSSHTVWKVILIAVLIGTGIHIAYRAWPRFTRPGAVMVSDLVVGKPLPPFRLVGQVDAADDLRNAPGCRVIVVFSPECPHCRVAAERDVVQSKDARYPLMWVGQGSQASVDSFVRGLSAPLTVLASPDVRTLLQVRAVPAAFLVGADDRIRLVFPYQGGVAKARLRALCEAPPA